MNIHNDGSLRKVRKGCVIGGILGIVSFAIPMASQAAPGTPGSLAARAAEPIKSVDYTCISCDIDAFIAHCDKNNGGLSKNPDGTTTCSIQPNAKSVRKGAGAFALSGKGGGDKNGVIYKCESDTDFCATIFADTCRDSGGGVSSKPDGGIVCTID